jgi:EpsI family protein
VCYPAQGFALGSLTKVTLDGAGAPLPAYRMTASLGSRHEFVTYWIRLGDIVVRGAIEQGLARLRYGLAGTLPDGLVFRVSDLGPSDRTEPTTWDTQDRFVTDLLHSLPPESRRFLVGTPTR